ncbi:MAG: PAS domain S-box protein [Mariprofundaceae bacterium]|nr:PAS domain S-box protein [Mariprofundaceae bacterium]
MLQVDEKVFRTMFDTSPNAIMLLDEHGFLACNPSTLKIFSCSSSGEFIGRHPSEYSPPTQADGRDSLQAADEKISVAYKTGSNIFEWTHRRANGEVFPAEVQLTLLKLKGGNILQATVRDITERKHTEDALRNAKEEARDIIQNARDAFIAIDGHGIIIDWNPEAARMFGFSMEEAIGRELAETIIPPEFRKAHIAGIKKYLKTGESKILNKHMEITAIGKDGDMLPVELSIVPLKRNGSVTFSAFIRSLSERDQAEQLLLESATTLKNSLVGTIAAISKAVEARDPYTAGHQQRVSRLSRTIAQEMGLDKHQIEGIRMGATIHDIGKIQVPAEILSKPSALNDLEYEIIKTHAKVGYEILKNIKFPWPIADIAHQHHEHLDGTGYPQGLKGDEICLEARIVAVADTVEAMGSHRPYRPSLGIETALNEITINRGKWYDTDVVDICLMLFKEKKYDLDEIRIKGV